MGLRKGFWGGLAADRTVLGSGLQVHVHLPVSLASIARARVTDLGEVKLR
jgi:hypothetical protein